MASRDLQIVRNPSARLLTTTETPVVSAAVSAGNPVEFVVAALKRQWFRLLTATIASACLAWAIASTFSTQKVTSRLTLSSQSLPATAQYVYTPPNPSVAAVMLKSQRILRPVTERHDLQSANMLGRQVNLFPNLATSSIDVALVHNDIDEAIAILNDIAAELINSIAQDRKQTLTEHAGYIRELLVSAKSDLGNGRDELAKLEESLRLKGVDSSQKDAEFYDLANRESDLKTSIGECRRKEARLQSDLKLLTDEFTAVRNAAFRAVVEARRRQSDRLGQRLKETAPAFAANSEIQRQLQAAEEEISSLAFNDANDDQPLKNIEGNGTEHEENLLNSGTMLTVAAESEHSTSGLDASELVADELTKWVEKISSIGKDLLGDLEPTAIESARTSWNKLSKIADEARKVQFEANNNKIDLNYYLSKANEIDQERKQSATDRHTGASTEFEELKLEVSEKENRYSQLSQQLDQINQLRDCELTEYVVTSSAAVNAADDVSSNKRNMFVCSFLGFMLLLSAPFVVIELMRLRPAPIHVISRRWNLPVLGSHSPSSSGHLNVPNGIGGQDLRLMALRIQQSLSSPSGRVVMFSGLDHEESPLGLIRSLSYCLAQREETVLMIHIPPTMTAASNWRSSNDGSFKAGRPGVAEFLASDIAEASSFVISTGVNGIDFLPAGCSAVASEAMASRRLTGLIESFREKYSMVILCGPSTLYPADLQMLAARADGIVFTVNQTSLNTVYGNEVIGDLLELGAPILGLAEQPLAGGGHPHVNFESAQGLALGSR